jgi:hypothetical protein
MTVVHVLDSSRSAGRCDGTDGRQGTVKDNRHHGRAFVDGQVIFVVGMGERLRYLRK